MTSAEFLYKAFMHEQERVNYNQDYCYIIVSGRYAVAILLLARDYQHSKKESSTQEECKLFGKKVIFMDSSDDEFKLGRNSTDFI